MIPSNSRHVQVSSIRVLEVSRQSSQVLQNFECELIYKQDYSYCVIKYSYKRRNVKTGTPHLIFCLFTEIEFVIPQVKDVQPKSMRVCSIQFNYRLYKIVITN